MWSSATSKNSASSESKRSLIVFRRSAPGVGVCICVGHFPGWDMTGPTQPWPSCLVLCVLAAIARLILDARAHSSPLHHAHAPQSCTRRWKLWCRAGVYVGDLIKRAAAHISRTRGSDWSPHCGASLTLTRRAQRACLAPQCIRAKTHARCEGGPSPSPRARCTYR